MDHLRDQKIVSDPAHAESRPSQAAPAAVSHGNLAPASAAFPRASARPADGPERTFWVWGVCGFLLLAVGLIYGQTLGHGLLDYDDSGFVFANPHVTAGLTGEGIRWAFTEGPFGEWYPLDPLSHMLDCQLFGLNAWGHHLTNVLLHAATSIALFLVLWRMTGELWPSAFVAAIFAVHPQHVETVAWVAERRDVLSGLFFMLTLGGLSRLRAPRPVARTLSAGGGAVCARPDGQADAGHAAAAVAAVGFLAAGPIRFGRRRPALDATRSSGPACCGWCWKSCRWWHWRRAIAAMTLRTHVQGGASLPWSERIGNAAVSCVTYVVQLFYPVDLAAFYPYPPGGPPTWKVAGAVAILAVASAAAVIWRRRFPYFFVGWFWYLGMLSPVLGLVKVSDHAMADRYMYLPGIGLYIALAWGAARLAAGSARGALGAGHVRGAGDRRLMACAAWQTSFWRDDETLWRHALACTTDNGKAEFGLADALARQGRSDEAIAHYRRAEQHPTDAGALQQSGGAAGSGGANSTRPSPSFVRRWQSNPIRIMAHVNLGTGAGVAKSVRRGDGTFPPRHRDQPARRQRAHAAWLTC